MVGETAGGETTPTRPAPFGGRVRRAATTTRRRVMGAERSASGSEWGGGAECAERVVRAPIASSSRPAPRYRRRREPARRDRSGNGKGERDGDGDDVHVDGRRSRSPASSPPPPTTTLFPPRAESVSRSPGPGGGGATSGARRTAISKMRKHELIEELTERGWTRAGWSRSCATG